MKQQNKPMIVILGPTASGKTRIAALVASKIDAEVISADSRQVYKGMDLGTGKDYKDYVVDDVKVPYHLIDIVDPGTDYNVYQYQKDFIKAYSGISGKDKTAILCGGSGMYIEAVLKGYRLAKVPVNPELRLGLKNKSDVELTRLLESFRELHNITDTRERDRLVRAIEIQQYYQDNPHLVKDFPDIAYRIFGVYMPREVIRARITRRLHDRLEAGMIGEVERLIGMGIEPLKLKYYGLEYKYVTQYLLNELNYDEMVGLLNTAIHQFAKRQMTWFRKMQRDGFEINWLDGRDPERFAEKVLYQGFHN